MSNTTGQFTFIESQQGSVGATTLSLIRSHSMRKVRQIKKVEAQKANEAKRISKLTRLARKEAPSEADTKAAKAALEILDIESWAREKRSMDLSNYVVVDDGICPLECVLRRSEKLRNSSHAEVLADPGMVDFVRLLLEMLPVRDSFIGSNSEPNDFPIELGTLLRKHLLSCEYPVKPRLAREIADQSSEDKSRSWWTWQTSKNMLLDRCLAHVGLCHSYFSMALASDSTAGPKEKARQLWHETEAIRTVRERLEHLNQTRKPASDSDIWAISLVGLQHALYGSPYVARIHLRGIVEMVSSRKFDLRGQARYMVESVVLSFGLLDWNGLPETFRHPYGALTHSALLAVEEYGLHPPCASAFLSPDAGRILSPLLLDIFLAISAINDSVALDGLATDESRNLLFEQSAQINFRLLHAGNSYHSINKIHNSSVTEQGCSLQLKNHPKFLELLRLTAILYIWVFQHSMLSWTKPMLACRRQIDALLLELESEHMLLPRCSGSWCHGLLTWVLVLLAASAIGDSVSSGEMYVRLARKWVMRPTERKNWKEAREVLRQYLWLDTAYSIAAEEFWTGL